MDKKKYEKPEMYEYKGEQCSNCHAGIVEDMYGIKKCINNYTYCDYSTRKPIDYFKKGNISYELAKAPIKVLF